MGENADLRNPTDYELPPDVMSQVEDAWFRNTGALDRIHAIARIEAAHPSHAEKVRAFVARFPSGSGEDEAAPERIGPYRIVSLLGRGGFGEVWRATQVEGMRRDVALKVLKLGMDTRAILQRFVREQDALARMNHDAIAKIFDAGTTELGKPWFSMELVEGRAITQFCAEHQMGLRERLRLFHAACLGVHHAHQKGVVHRDLKPSNILVTGSPSDPRPKLIDFGIARAIESEAETLDLTEHGAMLGTPRYMAPEQLRGDFDAVDTRTDVFALGAILFELCTGCVPHADAGRGTVPSHELRILLRDRDIERPSGAKPQPGRQEASWLRWLRGDLDWVVRMATAREQERRYASVAELAADIQRYLDDEPVVARPESTLYLVRKYVRRHRLQVIAVAGVLVTAVAGAVVSLRYAMLASEQAEQAERERLDVLRLAARQDLDALLREQDAMWPPHPDRIPAYVDWIARAERLVAQLPLHQQKRADLLSLARERSDEERASDRASHPSASQLAAVSTELAARERAYAVRDARRKGLPNDETAAGSAVDLTHASPLPSSARVRFDLARTWSFPERAEFGKERAARSILRELLAASPPVPRSEMHEVLAWAEHACGDDDAALTEIAQAESLTEVETRMSAVNGARLRDAVEAARSEEGMQAAKRELESLRAERDRLDREVDARRTWSFAPEDTTTAWWSAQLDALIRDLERLRIVHLDDRAEPDAVVGWGIARRLRFARSLESAFGAGGDVSRAWADTLPAISRAYPGLALRPQSGLVPIGPDPQSGLWEFAHMCSGDAPTRDAAGKLMIGPESAIVMVLVPSGSFRMGASRDPKSEAYDPDAVLVEEPPHEVRVSPYLLAKHEVTQLQWQRVMGTQPSAYTPRLHWITSPLHPVEQVSWLDADRFCRRTGLSLPTEAQWERAARGGATARWSIADSREDLMGKFNIADRAAARRGATWPSIADWPEYEDGWVSTCPIGTLPPNPFGFHEMLGNLWEWCADGYYAHSYDTHAAVDPIHPSDGLPQRTSRGGSFDNTIASVRVTSRDGAAPQVSGHTIGFRPARRVE
jgi:formylglycine-generating enzyme required for sulfatase activity